MSKHNQDDSMKILNPLFRLLSRFRYPVSLPEDVAKDLGFFSLSNFMSFSELVHTLTHPSSPPANLHRFMPRSKAEEVFRLASRKEKFFQNSLYSYYFDEGWLEFVLQFDEHSRLRRLYIQHKEIKDKIEIQLGQHASSAKIS
jgi:hypothetical protein